MDFANYVTEKDIASPLARYRILSPKCGLRVSPLQLGAMSIGDAWNDFMGSMDKEQSFKLLDAYYEAGGNFIDTANNYQNEQSETWLGEWMAERKNRDHLVIATKYTSDYRFHAHGRNRDPNAGGNHRRSLHVSLRDSLAKLKTDWIDILYLHWWDWSTSIEEVMDSLHAVVQQGKVHYLAISDAPAWVVSAANTYAQDHGKTPFVIYQGMWNVMVRDMEREILPMCRHFGMAITPWNAMGGGKFQTKKAIEERAKQGEGLRIFFGPTQSEQEEKISAALEKVAEELGVESITAVALAYVMAKQPYVFPIIGGRKIEHLKQNIAALEIRLSKEQIEYLESIQELDFGFPYNIIGRDPRVTGKGNLELSRSNCINFVQSEKPIGYE